MTRLTRRRALGALATSIASLSGCGYRRSLDIAWRDSFDGATIYEMGNAFLRTVEDGYGGLKSRIDIYEAQTGTKRASVDLDEAPDDVKTSNGRWFVNTWSQVVAIDGNGEQTGSMALPEKSANSPVPIDESRLLCYVDAVEPDRDPDRDVTEYYASIECYDLTTGHQWTIEADDLSTRGIAVTNDATAAGEDVIVAIEVYDTEDSSTLGGSTDHHLMRIGADGSIKWSREIGNYRQFYRLEDTIVIVKSERASVVDIATGTERIDCSSGSLGRSLAVGDRYYFAGNSRLHAKNLRTDETLWSRTIDQARNLMPVAGDDRGLYLSSDRGSLSIDPENGEVRWFQGGGELLGLCPSVALYQFGSVTAVERQ